jgi:hypothetical protein
MDVVEPLRVSEPLLLIVVAPCGVDGVALKLSVPPFVPIVFADAFVPIVLFEIEFEPLKSSVPVTV